jgi:hypothetical protein
MRILMMVLMVFGLTACGSAQYGSKESCDSAFSDMNKMVVSLTASAKIPDTAASSYDDLIKAMGQPDATYSDSDRNRNDPDVKNYRYFVSADNYCGQYLIDVKGDQIISIRDSKEYITVGGQK